MNTATTPSALMTRINDQWGLVQARWVTVPETLRRLLGDLKARIRVALELPTSEDLGRLAARLDEIEARLGQLAAAAPKARPTVAEKRVVRKSDPFSQRRPLDFSALRWYR